MKSDIFVALLSAVVALVAASVTIWGQVKVARVAAGLEDLRVSEQRRLDKEQVTARYREPLAHAVNDLQSRLYNILQQRFLEEFFDKGDDRSQSYVVNNTVFLIAQYFAWTEIVRRDIQYIDLGHDQQTGRLARLRDEVYTLFQTDELGRVLRVFAGEQRAIGERMVQVGPRGLECIGYGAFLDRTQAGIDDLTRALMADVRALHVSLPLARPRLIALQHALINLLEFLDPDYIRFPKDRRSKVPGLNHCV